MRLKTSHPSHLPFLLYMLSGNLKLGKLSQGTNIHVVFSCVLKSWFLTTTSGRSYEHEIHRDALCFPQHLVLSEAVLNTTSLIFTEIRVNKLVWRSIWETDIWSRTLQMSAYIHAPFNRSKQHTGCSGFLHGQTLEHCFWNLTYQLDLQIMLHMQKHLNNLH